MPLYPARKPSNLITIQFTTTWTPLWPFWSIWPNCKSHHSFGGQKAIKTPHSTHQSSWITHRINNPERTSFPQTLIHRQIREGESVPFNVWLFILLLVSFAHTRKSILARGKFHHGSFGWDVLARSKHLAVAFTHHASHMNMNGWAAYTHSHWNDVLCCSLQSRVLVGYIHFWSLKMNTRPFQREKWHTTNINRFLHGWDRVQVHHTSYDPIRICSPEHWVRLEYSTRKASTTTRDKPSEAPKKLASRKKMFMCVGR